MRALPRLLVRTVPLWLALLAAGCRTGPVRGEPGPVLERGRALAGEGRLKEATRHFRGVVAYHPDASEAEEARFRLAETYRKRRKGPQAFDAYREFAEEFPTSRFGVEAAEGEYALAQDFLEGRLPGWLFFAPARSTGVEILEHLQLHYRNHRLADDALLEAGLFEIEEGDHESATILLRRLLVDYPRSAHRMRARYELARCFYLLNQGPDYDERLLLRSRRGFRDFIGTARLDGLEERLARPIAAAERMIGRIDERLARHNYRIGRFYERIEEPGSALYYYRYCAREYPGTAAAADCRERLARLAPAPEGTSG